MTVLRSPAVQLIQLYWDNFPKRSSWRTINRTLNTALWSAIKTGFKFDLEDFEYIYSHFGGSYWMGSYTEGLYSLAVTSNNLSACRSYERWVGRKPFYWEGKRLHVDAKLCGFTRPYEVTSFILANGVHKIVLCQYARNALGRPQNAPISVKKLSLEELKKLRPESSGKLQFRLQSEQE